jgi:hypothetical protein
MSTQYGALPSTAIGQSRAAGRHEGPCAGSDHSPGSNLVTFRATSGRRAPILLHILTVANYANPVRTSADRLEPGARCASWLLVLN